MQPSNINMLHSSHKTLQASARYFVKFPLSIPLLLQFFSFTNSSCCFLKSPIIDCKNNNTFEVMAFKKVVIIAVFLVTSIIYVESLHFTHFLSCLGICLWNLGHTLMAGACFGSWSLKGSLLKIILISLPDFLLMCSLFLFISNR